MVSQAVAAETCNLLRCGIGQESYALEMAKVRSIHRADHLRQDPGADGSVGRLPTKEGAVPVYSLASLLGRSEQTEAALQHVVVLGTRSQAVGLLVGRVSQAARVRADSIFPLPPLLLDPAANYFRGVVQVDEKLLLVLEPELLNPRTRPASSFVTPPTRPKVPASPPIASMKRTRPDQGRLVLCRTSAFPKGQRPVSYGMTITQVLEVVEMPPLVPVPGTPGHVLGLARWRDRPVPVVDLDLRFGRPSPSFSRRKRLLIARLPGTTEVAGVVVLPAIRVLRLPLPHFPSRRQLVADESMVLGCVEMHGETLLLPDFARLL
jgi:purine-binding chemotaxis protein CheW